MIKIINEDYLFEMAKLTNVYADTSVCGNIKDFIYFSPCLAGHGPRVKFYGGTEETKSTKDAPTMSFTVTGETKLKLSDWMNKKNCPNGFDADYLNYVKNFIQKTLPILLLVWFRKLGEEHALKYFEGAITLDKALSYVCDIEESKLIKLRKFTTLSELHKFCVENDVYNFNK